MQENRFAVAELLEETGKRISEITGRSAVVSVQYLKAETTESLNKRLIEVVTNVCGVDWHRIVGRTRKVEVIIARHLYCYISRIEFGCTFKAIGRTINRDHTSAIHSVNVVVDMLQTKEAMFVLPYEEIIERLNLKK